VQFADIGAQEVKNIPTPVHAYMVAMRREDGTYATPQVKKPSAAQAAATPNWMWPLAVTVVCVVAIGVAGFLYFTRLEMPNGPKEAVSAATPAAPAPSPPPAPVAAAASATPPPAAPPAPIASGEKFAAATVPFVGDRARIVLANEYAPATDFKAFALNNAGVNAFVVAQPSEEAAKSAAVEQCQKHADAVQSPRKCEVYAVGNTVVAMSGHPPLPPTPWIVHDPLTERLLVAAEVPLVREGQRRSIEERYMRGRKSKAIAVGPGGQMFFYFSQESPDEAARRSLESCGAVAGVACKVVAVDDVFVVPAPTILKAIGFFHAADNSSIAAEAREEVVRKLADASGGWNAVAVGAAGRPGLALKALSEQSAVNEALGNCVKRDSDCHVIAIGPFSVGAN
jgi:adenylate cyclase